MNPFPSLEQDLEAFRMYLLDTDCQSLLDRDAPEARRLTERLLLVRQEHAAVTIVTYEEQMRGWLAWIAQAKMVELQVEGYRRLRQHIERFQMIPIVDFDARAASEFERLRKAGARIGTMDLKIACIALANQATVLTRNLCDYTKVPDLTRYTPWSELALACTLEVCVNPNFLRQRWRPG